MNRRFDSCVRWLLQHSSLYLLLAAALSVHALSKCAVAWASGGWHYAVAAGGGVLLHTGVFVAVLSLV